MLTQLQIRNFAVIERLELELGAGFTVLTGETGAGKSILVDALGLLLGDRADTGVIRAGADRTEVSAVFEFPPGAPLQSWLEKKGLDGGGGEIILRRVIAAAGRSQCFINDQRVTVQVCKELGEQLVDIHGQQSHQSLTRLGTQRRLLDEFAECESLADAVAAQFREWREMLTRLERFEQDRAAREAHVDLLRYHVHELEQAGAAELDWDELEQEHRRLRHAGDLIERCGSAASALYRDDDSIHDRVSRIAANVAEAGRWDTQLETVARDLQAAAVQLAEAANTLRDHAERLDADPERLAELERRVDTVQSLAHKHHVHPGELPTLFERLHGELQSLDGGAQSLDQLRNRCEALQAEYRKYARELSQRRVQAAPELGRRITGLLTKLGMPGGRFVVELQELPEGHPSASGLEQVQFLASANPGQPPAPIARVASGGELARISLAIEVIAARRAQIPTLIFDEVDTGVGGAVAETVGRQLRQLARRHQVLCVTHLPQVAALAHHHHQVSKQVHKRHTQAMVRTLQADERVEEIARMLGGLEITRRTVAHAREMIEHARRLDSDAA